MKRHEHQVLLTMHGGRARSVAHLYVLRQPRLSRADHAFLAAHGDALDLCGGAFLVHEVLVESREG